MSDQLGMKLRIAGELGVWLALCGTAVAQGPVVTETKWVENWDKKGTPREQLRKINGRWWTQDNREVQPPGKSGGFWSIDSEPGTCTFYHHRPVELGRAESLHLFMSAQEVERVMGQPNRTLGAGRQGFWWYYAANGTKLSMRFMGEDGLGEAKYEFVRGGSRAVASVAGDLGGRDIYKVMADRAWQRVQQRQAAKFSAFGANSGRRGAKPNVVAVDPVPVTAAEAAPPKRIVSAEALAGVSVGASREDVLAKLGEPSSRYAISDDDGTHESFTYDLDGGGSAVIRIVGGKVTEVRRP